MNVSAFEDMNYFDAVEKVLYSYGLVMRFVGSNRVAIMSLRDLPYQGKSGAPRPVEPTFLAHAQRELAPAVRRIEESVKYDIGSFVCKPVVEGDYTGTTEKFLVQGNSVDYNGIAWPIANKTSGIGWANPDYSLFFNPYAYEFAYDRDEDKEYMWIAGNSYELSTVGRRYAEYSKTIVAERMSFIAKFGNPYFLGTDGKLYQSGDSIKSVTLVVKAVQGGTESYLQSNGEWTINQAKFTVEISGDELNVPISFDEYEGSILLCVQIHQILTSDDPRGFARYIPLYSASLAQNYPLLETNNVNTKYIDANNIVITRDPGFGPAYNVVSFPSAIKNGIFVKSDGAYLPAKKWAWSGGTPQQMAVYNHLQLLCYHSKPNNVISGDIVYADFVDMAAIYEWGGANHILVSGSYNFLNGHIESAVLREFQWYNDMWGDANLPEVEEDKKVNVGTVRPGSSSGGSTGGGTSGGGGSDIVVDSAMSSSSTNPVQNKVVKKYVDDAETRAKKYTDDNIAQIETGGGSITVDTEMSDSSENAVQNKVIKAYVDKHPQYEVIEDIEVPDLPEGPQGSVDLTGYATEQWVENKGYATRSWVNGRNFATEQWVGNQGFVDKTYVGSQINAYSSNTYALIAALEERITALEKMLEGVDGASGCYFIPTGVTFADDIVSVSYDKVGVMVEPLTVKTIAKITGSIPCAKESTVSSSLANLVTMFNENDLSIVYVPGNQYTIEITVVTSDSNGTTTKKESFTFTA
jgi:hypothetical protein